VIATEEKRSLRAGYTHGLATSEHARNASVSSRGRWPKISSSTSCGRSIAATGGRQPAPRAGAKTKKEIGGGKDKRAIGAYRPRPSAFCCPPPVLYADQSDGRPTPRLPLPTMHLNQLILSLILIWAPFRSAYAMPTSKVVVELSACGMSPESSHTLLSQQVSFPPWILSADRTNREVPSAKRPARQSSMLKNTASAMRRVSVQLCLPDILQSCIQCSVDQVDQDRLPEVLSLIPPRLRGMLARISLRSPQIYS
jgi:hypothetical protein